LLRRDAIPSWATLRSIGNSRVVKLSSLFPFVGYMILFNDDITKLLELSRSYLHAPQTSTWMSTLVGLRLYFIYFGLFSLGAGSIVYQWKCPYAVKKFADGADYVSQEIATLSKDGVRVLAQITGQSYSGSGDDALLVIRNGYGQMSLWYRMSRLAVATLFGLGLFLLAIPSFISTIQVLQSLLLRFLGR
jgi:hypothetical protein